MTVGLYFVLSIESSILRKTVSLTRLYGILGSERFSHLMSSYWQVDLPAEARNKTAFSTGYFLYQFKVMLLVLWNATETFVRLMELILRWLTWNIYGAYLKDIIMAQNYNSRLSNLKEVFTRPRYDHLQVIAKKLVLYQ